MSANEKGSVVPPLTFVKAQLRKMRSPVFHPQAWRYLWAAECSNGAHDSWDGPHCRHCGHVGVNGWMCLKRTSRTGLTWRACVAVLPCYINVNVKSCTGCFSPTSLRWFKGNLLHILKSRSEERLEHFCTNIIMASHSLKIACVMCNADIYDLLDCICAILQLH